MTDIETKLTIIIKLRNDVSGLLIPGRLVVGNVQDILAGQVTGDNVKERVAFILNMYVILLTLYVEVEKV